MRRRTLYNNNTYAGILSNEAVAGDICLYNKQQDRLELYSQNVFDNNTFPLSKYTPVGIVAVPGTHNVYSDGSCAIVSLKNMSMNTPDTGTFDFEQMYCGGCGYGSSLPSLGYVPYVGSNNNGGDANSTVKGIQNSTYLPSDYFAATENPHDSKRMWYYSNNQYVYFSPSPYLTNGSRNPAYYQTSSPSSTSNCLSDFNGKENTLALTNSSTYQSDWKTSDTILFDGDELHYPAACCCWRYHTPGTKQGDWYLPACGELGYLLADLYNIKQFISRINIKYNTTIASTIECKEESYNNAFLWSSTERNIYEFMSIRFYDGFVLGQGDTGDFEVHPTRAFLRVKI